jgi:hypothetical protein
MALNSPILRQSITRRSRLPARSAIWPFLVKLTPDSLSVAVGTAIADRPRTDPCGDVHAHGSYRGGGGQRNAGFSGHNGILRRVGCGTQLCPSPRTWIRGCASLVSRQNKILASLSPWRRGCPPQEPVLARRTAGAGAMRTGLRPISVSRRAWSLTHTRNIGCRAFFRISIMLSCWSSR